MSFFLIHKVYTAFPYDIDDKIAVKYLINNDSYEECTNHIEKDIHGNEKTIYEIKNSLSKIMIHSTASPALWQKTGIVYGISYTKKGNLTALCMFTHS